MSSGPRDPEARAPRPDRRDWQKAKLVVPENALREAGMGRLQGSAVGTESRSGTIGPINLEVKQTGERSTGNPYAAVRRGGGWKRGMVEMM